MEFQEFPKMARLTRDCVITEKIDGTNAQIYICPMPDAFCAAELSLPIAASTERGFVMLAGSRSKWLTLGRDGAKDGDNFGFAKWVREHADDLWTLGEGRHFGEWWGSGIQRGYGLTNGEKRFSLFNVARWADERDREKFPTDRPSCCSVVPVLYQGLFGPKHAENMIERLRHEGSAASPGFMNPEGVVVFHTASGTMFKKTIEKDEVPKSKAS